AEKSAMNAGGGEPLAAECAGAVGEGERHHHDVADVQRADVAAERGHDADRLVAHAAGGLALRHQVVWPEIAAAYARAAHRDERVGRLDQARVGNDFDTYVVRPAKNRGSHRRSFSGRPEPSASRRSAVRTRSPG